ncbi:MAG TPA: Spy/CpxP family protein refolding chaperone [Anaeromyxobacter sp.]|nr:Spy/CpxP family protein refolding chaperone [Anaeromyxobacter sp.]
MKKVPVFLSMAAAAIVAVLLPGMARSRSSDAPSEELYGPCGGYESGMMGPSYRAGMWGMAERGGAFGRMGRSYGLGPLWKLDLSDAQRVQVKKIADDLRRSHRETRGKLRDAREELRGAEVVAEPEPTKVGAAFAEVSRLRQNMLEATVRARNQVRSILTPAQRHQFDDWRELGWDSRGSGLGAMGQG